MEYRILGGEYCDDGHFCMCGLCAVELAHQGFHCDFANEHSGGESFADANCAKSGIDDILFLDFWFSLCTRDTAKRVHKDGVIELELYMVGRLQGIYLDRDYLSLLGHHPA